FLLFLSLHEDVVGDGVPGIVNPDKEQQQRCSSNGKQRLAQMGASGECRYCQNCVCHKRQQNMKQPVLELRFVCRLQPHTTSHNGGVHDPTQSHQAPQNCSRGGPVPRGA